jgi:DNA polymerase-3 subunit epsilon
MFAPAIAFVDLETTGMSAGEDRVTEVGIVRVDDGVDVAEWSTLVNPQRSIPGAVQAMTGITNAMVAEAPTFEGVADEVQKRVSGCIFVAHNARFDYGFLKHEFGRLGRAFSAKVLCTVKLSRRLYAEEGRHNLDAVIERHGLAVSDRHRALGDARVLWDFVQTLYRSRAADDVDAAVARILKKPSLPSHLAPDALDALPEGPGVYRFYGANALPLYIGKSVNIRERVAAHFSSDYRSANDARLSAEVTRIEFEETAGELGALLREARLIKTMLPAYNQRLRRRADLVALQIASEPGPPEYIPSEAIEPSEARTLYGPFASRRAARRTLLDVAREAALCWKMLGLDRRSGPCFARQLHKCAGVCIGAEAAEAHEARLRNALARYEMQPWPYKGMAAVREANITGTRTEVHVFRDWCWLGSASDDGALQDLVESPPRPQFDLDVYRILASHLRRHRVFVIASVPSSDALLPL